MKTAAHPWYKKRMKLSNSRAACVAVCLLFLASAAWCTPPIERTEYNLLGTTCTVRIYTGGNASAIDAAFDRIAEIEKRMTINKPDSEVDLVNDSAGKRPVKVTADVLYVVEQGLKYSEDGNGAFDITIAPLVKLWGIGTEGARVPDPSEIRSAIARIGYKDLVVNEKDSTVFLRKVRNGNRPRFSGKGVCGRRGGPRTEGQGSHRGPRGSGRQHPHHGQEARRCTVADRHPEPRRGAGHDDRIR